MPQLHVIDFSGGITDNYLDAPPNQYEEGDNFLIRNNKKLETRPGTVIYDNNYYQFPAGSTRVAGFPKIENDVLFQNSGRNLYYINSGWNTLLGASSNPALAAGATTSYPSWSEWNSHLLITNDSFGSPMKVYRDQNNVLRVRNAGLPKVTLTACIELANNLKTKFNLHIASSIHTVGVDSTNQVTSPDAYDFPTLATLAGELVTDYTAHNADANLSSGRLYHGGQQGSTNTLTTTNAPLTLTEIKASLDNLKEKYNAHDADSTAHSSGSTFQASKYSEPQVSGGTTSSSQYVYYFVAKYIYKVGDTTYIDRGATYAVVSSTLTPPNSSTVTISQIPTIANASTENFDTANIVWEIYRTTQNGSVPYYVKEITNGTTSTTDAASDASISVTGAPTIYTNGGDKDNDMPPQAKFVIIVDNVAWYGYVKEGNQIRKTRIRQSKRFDIDSCPEDFYVDLEDELVGLGSFNNFPIAVCKNRVYRIEGTKDDQGRGTIERKEIARGIGGVNHLSIVNTYKGVFFAGLTGWYWTDGFEVRKISPHLDESYPRIVSTETKRKKIYGLYDAKKDRIRWALCFNSTTENDTIYTLDLNFPLFPEASFTTESPASNSWNPSAMAYDLSNDFVIGDSRGYLFKSDSNSLTDPKVDTTLTPSSWQESAIVWDFKGTGVNMGEYDDRKIATHLTVVADNVTPLSLRPKRKHDDSGYFKELAEIRTRDNIVWGDPFAPSWNPTIPAYPWRTFPLIIQRRRFPRENLRYLYTQIQFTNSNTIIYRSDDYGLSTVAASSSNFKTATLSVGNNLSWPTDAIDYYVSFESDNYTKRYLITGRTTTVITFVDTNDSATTGTLKKWIITGVRKREKFNLVSYTIEFEKATNSHPQYRGDDGGNSTQTGNLLTEEEETLTTESGDPIEL